jgi:hypothetical protein
MLVYHKWLCRRDAEGPPGTQLGLRHARGPWASHPLPLTIGESPEPQLLPGRSPARLSTDSRVTPVKRLAPLWQAVPYVYLAIASELERGSIIRK